VADPSFARGYAEARATSARRRPAKIRKGGGAAPLKTAKEPGEKHRLEPYFILGEENFLIIKSKIIS
jgi:hypothetical protein